MGWQDTIQPIQAGSWKDTIQEIPQDPTMLDSLGRGLAQGFSGGFQDELGGAIAGLGRVAGFKDLEHGIENGFERADGGASIDFDKIKDAYTNARDIERSRNNVAAAENPKTYMAGNIGGGVLQSVAMPSLSAAGDAGLAANIGKGALQGGVAGAGYSDADSAEGLARDTAIGAGLGGGAGAASYGAGRVLSKLPNAESGISKLASFASGVDEDAALRQLQRPTQVRAAQGDKFVHDLAIGAMAEAEARGQAAGQGVARAGKQFLENSGDLTFENANKLSDKVSDFMLANEPSPMGFSAVSESQFEELNKLRSMFQQGDVKGEDLYKLRGYLDHLEGLAGKYDKEGSSPYVNLLKGLRHDADAMIDQSDPALDSANRAFGQYKTDTSLLRGATNEGQAESMISNLYGANKGAKQEAAARLFSPETMESAKDIAANKAFENAKRPGGDNYFRRGALAAITGGASELVTSPGVWKQGLRATGWSADKIGDIVRSKPELFGKYASVLQNALLRGPEGLAATHFILESTDPGYREVIRAVADGDQGN